jgi:hypothetical protein
VEWSVEYTDEFEYWWESLDEDEQESWYDTYVPLADRIYDEHIQALKKENNSHG